MSARGRRGARTLMRCERPSSAMEPMASSKPCCGKKRNCQRQYISSRRRRSLAWAGQRRASGCRCQPSARLGTYAGLWPQGSRKPPARPHARAAACSGLPGSSSSPSKPRASLTLLRNAAHGPGTAPAAGRREGFRDQVRAPAPAAVHPLRAAGWGCSVRQRQTRLCGRAHLVPLPAVALPEAGGEVVEELREGAALLRTRAPPTRRPAGTGCQQVMRSAALLRRQPAGAASARTLMFS